MSRDENPRWKFKNSLKLNLKRLEKPVSHGTIFNLLDETLTRHQRNQITSIYNFSSNKLWIIEFNPILKLTDLFERTVN